MQQNTNPRDLQVMDFNGDIPMPAASSSKRQQMPGKRTNTEFVVITYVFFAVFLFLAGYFSYFLTFRSESFINHPSNSRISKLSEHTKRGSILSSDGKVLASSSESQDGHTETRTYPYGRVFAHAIGYSVNGLSGLELEANFHLLRSHSFIVDRIRKDLAGEKTQGDSVIATYNAELQKCAYDGLGSYQGAVVAIEPDTGKLLCLVSKPDYDPNTVAADWNSLVSDNDHSRLLNRVTQGLYPPGSTFKILTAREYLREGGTDDDSFKCDGVYESGGYEIHCFHGSVHGSQSFKQAFANSCNTAFAKTGLSLKKGGLASCCKDFLFDTPLPTALMNTKQSRFRLKKNASDPLVMQTAIGQGDTLVTPLHMAMIAASISNMGVLMSPYDIDHIENDTGDLVRSTTPEAYGKLISKKEAKKLRQYMRAVIENGTGRALAGKSYKAFGKTGTAEYSSDKNKAHSWFVGFAEKNGKKIAVAVIMEGAGAGSSYALPLAGKLFDNYLG